MSGRLLGKLGGELPEEEPWGGLGTPDASVSLWARLYPAVSGRTLHCGEPVGLLAAGPALGGLLLSLHEVGPSLPSLLLPPTGADQE